ncbi:MAG: isoprenylcysteine carboxylmethyltransferase family protein [Propionibacteriaceae bacterium]|nr:isoprenylcysteine carboxylmethyltransferase family protein [Propionibacteriaceae bacterium]
MPSATMIGSYLCAYVLLVGFFVIERFVRRGEGTKDMGRTHFDQGSTTVISIVMGVAFVIVPLVPLWNWLAIGPVLGGWACVVGVVAGVVGLIIRYVAFSTLGRFFTRTLREQEDHQLVTTGIYQYVRHPGYLSDLLIFAGASLAMRNLTVFIVVIVLFIPAYLYRIRVEEKMLIEVFGPAYTAYQKTSHRLIPGLW